MAVTLDTLESQLRTILSKISLLNIKVDFIMTVQDDIDQATLTVQAEVAAEEADIATEASALQVLQAYILAHPDAPNVAALQSAVAKLSLARADLDAAAAAEVAAEPVVTPPPVTP